MRTKIIEFHSDTQIPELKGKDRLTNAAYQFATCLLWHHQYFTNQEINRTKKLIHTYLQTAPDKKDAFLIFCERIALAERQLSAGISSYLPLPSIWLNPNYDQGFTATLPLLSSIRKYRDHIPGYMEQISIIAQYFTEYALHPNAKAIRRCRRKLIQLRAYGMLQHFFNVIVHLNYIPI